MNETKQDDNEPRWYCIGVVNRLCLPPLEPRTPMVSVSSFQVDVKDGIAGAPARELDHRPAKMKVNEDPDDRQICILHHDSYLEFYKKLGKVRSFQPEALRWNLLITSSRLKPDDVMSLLGRELLICSKGKIHMDACRLILTQPCIPCKEMNFVCPGLFAAMKNKAGLFARVISNGTIEKQHHIYCLLPPPMAAVLNTEEETITLPGTRTPKPNSAAIVDD